MRTRNIIRGWIICLIWLFSLPYVNAVTVYVPLDHWVYDFLDRMQTRGITEQRLFQSRPYSRSEVAGVLVEISSSKEALRLGTADRALLRQLMGEFSGDICPHGGEMDSLADERHLLSWRDDHTVIHADLLFGAQIQSKECCSGDQEGTISRTTAGGSIRGQSGSAFAFYMSVTNTLTRGEDIAEERFDPLLGAPVTISGGNVYSDDASAYLVWQLPWFEITAGRDQVHWGPGINSGLLLSGQNPRFDQVRLRFTKSRFQFISLHGKLYGGGQRYLAAHRLEWRLHSRLILAGSESVVYGGRNPEPAYLNPLMIYHVAEHHLGDRDNNMMSLDALFFPYRGHRIYTELFLDDFSFSENPLTYYGNKWALTAGWQWAAPFGMRGMDVSLEYTRLEPFVYTHADTLNIYRNYNSPIGHWLGPDSDGLFLKITCLIHRNLQMAFLAHHIRQGESDINTPHTPEMGTEKSFLTGIVESTSNTGLMLRWQVFRDAFLTGRYAFISVRNTDHVPGQTDSGHSLFMQFTMNY